MQKRWKGLLVFGFITLGILVFNQYDPLGYVETLTFEEEVPIDIQIDIKEPTIMYGMVVDNRLIIEDKVKRNQFLADILEEYNVPVSLINQVSLIPRNVFDVRKIGANKKYTLICTTDSLKTAKALVYEPNDVDYVVFKFEDSLHVDVCSREVSVAEREISGIIESTLSNTIQNLGVTHILTNKFVDIFAWQVDFQRLYRGDKFKLIFEEMSVDGKVIGIGKILGIYFEHMSTPYYAVPFDQGEGLDYFDGKGKSLRKALLKYPIEFTRISSRYSRNRFHPVQKRWKAHLGTDFAAPTGTPIRSVGEGTVLEARYTRNNGNYVKIRHNGTFTTQYLHMSKIASGIRPGVRVRQGQWIGNVGSTGLATGSHLCYRFWKNGIQVDALRIELPPSQPIKAEFEAAYQIELDRVKQRLDSIPSAEVQESVASIL